MIPANRVSVGIFFMMISNSYYIVCRANINKPLLSLEPRW